MSDKEASASGTLTYYASAPFSQQPIIQPPLRQLLKYPFLQKKQSPQKVTQLAATLSPFLNFLTSSPT